MSTRDIEAHTEEVDGAKVSRELISDITDVVVDEIKAWQARPLDEVSRKSSVESEADVPGFACLESVGAGPFPQWRAC